ncbi:MAG: DNA polymerase III subunit delta [Deltaproteobacteria bacterium]|nr:DNA polymerase III subunit delta [Deltaproteobacteria bacterium]
MAQDGLKIIENLKKGRELLPVYCFYGDSYLIEEAVQDIKAKVLSSAFKDMNYNSYDPKETDAETIISTAQTFPVVAQKRLVIINRAESLSRSQQEAILFYIKNPATTTCLILLVLADKVDKRLSLFSELEKAGYLFYFKAPSDAQLPFWIKKEAERLGKKIDDDAIGVFLEAVGSELMDIKQEIDKLALFVGERDRIKIEDVETAVANGRVDTVFDLADSIGRRDLRRGMINLKRILEQGEEPVKIMGMIVRQFRIIWRVKALNSKAVAINSIANILGIFSSYIGGYLKQGENFTAKELLRIFKTLHKADIALKSGRQTPDMVMERLILELCSKDSEGFGF